MKTSRVWFLTLAISLALGASVALAAKPVAYNLGVEPKVIDPARSNANDQQIVLYNTYEGLLRPDEGHGIMPGCAEKWEPSDDGLTWTFHLRPDLEWSDGTPLTAAQFRYGFIRAMDSSNACPYAELTYFIKNAKNFFDGKCEENDVGIEAPDARTLILHLDHKTPLMFDYLATFTFAPAREDLVSKNPMGWSSTAPVVSNGAYYVADWKHNSEMTLRKNPHYWDARNVGLDSVRLLMITDTNTALAAYRSGDVDILDNLPPLMTPSLIRSGEAKVRTFLGTSYTMFNTAVKPFDDLRVRRAFALALDRRTIVDKVTMGGQEPANAFIPAGIAGAVPGGEDFRSEDKGPYLPPHADVALARKLLAEAGYPGGKGFPAVTYTYNGNPVNKTLAEAIQTMWKKNLGVNVQLIQQEWKVFLDTRNQKQYHLARAAWISDFDDAGGMLDLWTTHNYENSTGWSNADYDALMAKVAITMDRVERTRIMHKAERILMNDMPMIPIYFYAKPYMVKDRVKGLYMPATGGIFFRGAYVMK